jgi:hypothetical protein
MFHRNWYRKTQAEFVAASANFAAQLIAHGESLHISEDTVAAFVALNTTLQSAYIAAVTPETRTAIAVSAKNSAMADVRRMAMGLTKLLISDLTVSDDQLILMGLPPRISPTARPAEMTAPVVQIVGVKGRIVTARIRQQGADTSARPIGSVGALVFTFVGNEIPTDPNAYQVFGLATRGIIEIQFPNEVPSGANAFIAAAWLSQRGERGFACNPVPVTIQGGPVLAAG